MADPLSIAPASAVTGYFSGCADPGADRPLATLEDLGAAGVAVPELVALGLRERMRLLDAGVITRVEWNAAADEWAALADARYRACAELRPGGPYARAVRLGVKDTVDVAGFATRLGLRRYRRHPVRDAAALRDLGPATVTAKLTTTEVNIGIGSGCVNPLFPQIDPAGSSTGCGVAVAGRICDLALGTDVLGSVRWPAGRCGVVGLRTTHDPAALPGMFPLSPLMDAVGWVARSADDFCVLAERGVLSFAPPDSATAPLRVGVVAEVGESDPQAEVICAVKTAGEALACAGHRVRDARLGDLWNRRGDAWELCARQAWEGYLHWRDHVGDGLSASTLAALRSGEHIAPRRADEIIRELTRTRARITELFDDAGVDAWLLPLDPDVPRPVGDRSGHVSLIVPGHADYDREIGYTPVASYAGLPAVTFPVGVDDTGRAPLAVQLIGRPGAEADLLRLARDVERQLVSTPALPR